MRSEIALALALLVGPAPEGGSVLLERILAVVNSHPVFLSNVRLLERVKGLSEKAALDELIDEALMGEEAARLPQAAVTADEEDRVYRELVSRLGGIPEDVGEAELKRLVHSQAVILKYVDFRFRTEVRISDGDVQKAYLAQYGQSASAPALSEVSDVLRKGLEDAQVGEKVEAWVKELRASAEIRYNSL
ncbi:MAG TPA: hypothetical protein VN083_11875 [Vicinamibacteria bacterium]|jgi:hypothetical protein|nr:hypothetical protein [Vicinamibacteria bacterium]